MVRTKNIGYTLVEHIYRASLVAARLPVPQLDIIVASYTQTFPSRRSRQGAAHSPRWPWAGHVWTEHTRHRSTAGRVAGNDAHRAVGSQLLECSLGLAAPDLGLPAPCELGLAVAQPSGGDAHVDAEPVHAALHGQPGDGCVVDEGRGRVGEDGELVHEGPGKRQKYGYEDYTGGDGNWPL